MAGTHAQRLADVLMGGTLDQYVSETRAAGGSWRKVARGIRERTGGQVDVTGEAVRNWYIDEPEAASA